jgi:hypothetical protein
VTLPAGEMLHVDIMNSNAQRDIVVACGLLTGR